MNAWIGFLPPETREWAELLVEAKAYPWRSVPVMETGDCFVGRRGVLVASPGQPPKIPAGLRVWWDDSMVTAVTHGSVIDLELPEGLDAARRVLERRGIPSAQTSADGVLEWIPWEHFHALDTKMLKELGGRERWRRLVLARALLATADREPEGSLQARDREAAQRGTAAAALLAPSSPKRKEKKIP